jgi:cellulose synthase/poly-beta-1,6-N-acetylglucosamine synthase-like glycosyltransferase
MEKISVIIPVKNEAKKIETCIEAVLAQSYPAFEVIVVDGHSTDETVCVAQKFPVKILYENYRTRAGANQVGIENSNGNYIAFTDADCIPKKDWLENLIKEFKDGIVGVGGGIINLGDGIWARSINLAVGTFLGSANSVQGRFFKEKRFVNSISGCNSMYRKRDLVDIKGFDVTLGTAEDTELNSKLLKMGKLLYTPDAIICHNHNRGVKDFAKRMFQYGYGRAQSRLWDIQIIPPVFLIILLASVVITPLVLIGFAMLYFILLFFTGFYFSWKEKDPRFIFSIPIILFLEHSSYTLGFWRGIF